MSNSETVIRAENVSKLYRIGARYEQHDTFGGMLIDMLKAPYRNLQYLRELNTYKHGGDNGQLQPEDAEHIWAVKDVSFEVKRGEVLGIIGRNGAGKSTLLKILSRITEPTCGRITMKGRASALLEVGTGFHPELTGRENIYLNGAILGMKKREIDSKFDAIVDFAGVQRFLDTPVKRYSSGMTVRLAFSVAAHLEPEILIVDEVLAVGDVEFQRKCLGKMHDVTASEGRTVLFVSHNMGAIQNMCHRAILLRNGENVMDGDPGDVVSEYLTGLAEGAGSAFSTDNKDRGGDGRVRLTAARCLNHEGQVTDKLIAGLPAAFEFDYVNHAGVESADVNAIVYNEHGVGATVMNTLHSSPRIHLDSREGTLRCELPELPFPKGAYRVAAIMRDAEQCDNVPNALTFDVVSSTFYPSGRTPVTRNCAVMVHHDWKHCAPLCQDTTC